MNKFVNEYIEVCESTGSEAKGNVNLMTYQITLQRRPVVNICRYTAFLEVKFINILVLSDKEE